MKKLIDPLNNLVARIKTLFAPPVFAGDEQKTRSAALISAFMLILLTCLSFLIIVLVLDGRTRLSVILVQGSVILGIVLLNLLLRRGYVRPAGIGFLSLVFIGTTLVGVSQGTIRTPAMSTYLFMVIVAGLLFEWRGILISTLASSLAVLCLVLAENAGLLPSPDYTNTLIHWISFTSLFAITGSLGIYNNQLMRRMLNSAEQEIARREHAERELRKLSRAVEQSPASIIITDLDANIEYVNARFTQVTGYSTEEVIGRNPRFLKTELTPPETYTQLWETIRAGRQWRGEFVNRKKDGSFFHELAIISPITDLAGVATHYLAVIEDITERAKTERALKESEARFRTMFEHHNAIMFLMEPDSGKILDANQAAEAFYGYSRAQLKNMYINDLNMLSDEQIAAARRNAAAGRVNYFVFPHRLATGEIRTVEVHTSPVIVSDQPALFSIIHDITAREQMAEALRESEARWQFALEGAGDGVWDWNAQTNKVFFSKQWKAMLGFAEHEIGDSLEEWATRVHPEDMHHVQQELDRHFSGQAPVYVSEHRMKCKDGEYKWILDRGKVISWAADRKPLRVIGTHTDITERKKMEESLRASREEIQTMLDAIPDLMFEVDRQGHILNFHAPAQDRLYVSPEIFMGRVVKDVLPVSAAEVIMNALAEADERNWHRGGIYSLDLPSGRCWFELSIQAKTRTADTTQRFIILARDITQRKDAQDALKQSEEKYRAIIELSPIPYALSDDEQRITLVNPAFIQTFGYTLEDIPNLEAWWVHAYPDADYRQRVSSAWQQRLDASLHNGIAFESLEVYIRCKDGTVRLCLVSAASLADSISGVHLVVFYDITARKRAEDAERELRNLAEALSNSAAALNSTLNFDDVLDRIMDNVGRVVPHDAVGVFLLDASDQIAQNVAFRDISGRVAKNQLTQFMLSETRNLREMYETGQPILVEDTRTYQGWIITHLNGWVRTSLGVPIKVRGEVIGFVCLDSGTPQAFTSQSIERLQAFVDQAAIAIENARLYGDIQTLATMDALTGVFNRTFFETKLTQLEERQDLPVSILVGDLDNLKIINDNLGHAAGDTLLRHTAQALRDSFRAEDIIARIGGDEFAVLLPGTDPEMLEHLLAKLLSRLAEHNTQHPELAIELSLGISTAESGTLLEAYRMADQRMYVDKASRKPT